MLISSIGITSGDLSDKSSVILAGVATGTADAISNVAATGEVIDRTADASVDTSIDIISKDPITNIIS